MNQDIQIQGSSSGSDFFEEKKCDIFLRIFFRTIPSEEIRIVGNIPELGAWNINNCFPLNTDSQMYPYWFNLKHLKVAKNTNIEFKIVIFRDGKFHDWEKLPNNGNRYHFIKFSKVCLEMKEFVADIKERAVAKFDSENDIEFTSNLFSVAFKSFVFEDDIKWRKIGVGKKICPYELAKESESENSSDKISDLIGDMISPNCFDSSSFMSASKSVSESQSDFESESDFNEKKAPIRAGNKLGKYAKNEVKQFEETKPENTFQEIYDKYIKNVFKSSKKKISNTFIKATPSFFLHSSKVLGKASNLQQELFIILSFFPPVKIKRIKEKNKNSGVSPDSSPSKNPKWKITPILDIFYSNFYNYLLKSKLNFLWFCWPGLYLPLHEQNDLHKYLQENCKIVPVFFDSMKIQSFMENICAKRIKPACQNNWDFYSSGFEFEQIDFVLYNEINKTFAKTALKLIAGNNCSQSERSFFILSSHLMRAPFYLRKTILKSKKISKPFHHKVAIFFNDGFPNPDNIRFLGNYRKLLTTLLFSDLLIFSVYDHARNFCLNCEKYLLLSHKTNEGGRLYLEFNGKIIFINIYHPYLDYTTKIMPRSLARESDCSNSANNTESKTNGEALKNGSNENIRRICSTYKDYVIITSMDKIDKSSMIEMKFQAFSLMAQKQTAKNTVLIQLLYNVFEDCFLDNTEYVNKLTHIAEGINKSLVNHRIEVICSDKMTPQTVLELYKQTSVFLKLSFIRDETYMHHLQYICTNEHAIVILSNNLFQTKAFKSLIPINSLNMNSIQNALKRADSLLNSKEQECLVLLDREYLRCNNVAHWLVYNFNSLQCFNYYNDKEFKLLVDKILHEGDTLRLMPVTQGFEEYDIKNIANAYKATQNRVFVLDFEGLFFDVGKINELLNTHNILEIESKLGKCKPSVTIINDETFSKFKNIVQDPKNSVYLVSSLCHEKLVYFFPDMKNLTLFSENSYLCQKLGRDDSPFVNFYEKSDTSWKAIVQTVILEYVAKTEGSYLIEKKYSLLWIYDKVDKEFANIQAKELLEHLNEVLEFIDVIEIVKYETLIEVRLKNCHKGMACVMGVYETFVNKGPIDFFLCIGGTREFSSDMFLASKTLLRSKDPIFEENVAFFNCSADPNNYNSNADGYFKEQNEFHKLISLLDGGEEIVKDFGRKLIGKGGGGVFKKMNFEEEDSLV